MQFQLVPCCRRKRLRARHGTRSTPAKREPRGGYVHRRSACVGPAVVGDARSTTTGTSATARARAGAARGLCYCCTVPVLHSTHYSAGCASTAGVNAKCGYLLCLYCVTYEVLRRILNRSENSLFISSSDAVSSIYTIIYRLSVSHLFIYSGRLPDRDLACVDRAAPPPATAGRRPARWRPSRTAGAHTACHRGGETSRCRARVDQNRATSALRRGPRGEPHWRRAWCSQHGLGFTVHSIAW